MQNFENIPREMREFEQWVVWRYENRGSGKQTKVPYNPNDARFAEVNNPNTWATYDRAVASVGAYDGIGFVLSLTDPYCFVDFDDPFEMTEAGFPKCSNPDGVSKLQQELHNEFDSYSERSPSGKGLHVICKAAVLSGRRRDAIEVYSSMRYMTMTGNVYNDKPIKFQQAKVSTLWETLEGVNVNAAFESHNIPSESSDLEIYNRASMASNGQKFIDLWNGNIDLYHSGDHSRADFAIVDILAYYTQDREQIARLFRSSKLGQRAKAKREKYVTTMITRAFDRLPPPIDTSQLMTKINDFLGTNTHIDFEQEVTKHQPLVAVKKTLVPVAKIEIDYLEPPPGLTGEIADFIFKQAWKPVPQIAVMGALGLMAGLAGRAYNASGSGLSLYLLMLAKTGRGKEAVSKGYEKIFKAITPLMPTIRGFKGPGDLASGQALLRYVSEHETKSFCSVFGEFGPMLKRITSSTANSSDLMTQKVMLDMYTKSGKDGMIDPTAYSDAERNTEEIFSPGFSFFAESAPKWFDENVSEGMIETGLLPRFIIAEYDGIRVPSNSNGPSIQPSQKLLQDIMTLATCSLACFQQNVFVDIPYDELARDLSKCLDVRCDDKINSSSYEIICELWNRVHLNTIRVAGVIAVGINPHSPLITTECWQWAERYVIGNVERLEKKFTDGSVLIDTDESAETATIETAILNYLTSDYAKLATYKVPANLYRARIVPYGYLLTRCVRLKQFKNSKLGPTNAIKKAIANLCDSGDLQEIAKTQAIKDFDFHGRAYAIRSIRILEKAKHELLS